MKYVLSCHQVYFFLRSCIALQHKSWIRGSQQIICLTDFSMLMCQLVLVAKHKLAACYSQDGVCSDLSVWPFVYFDNRNCCCLPVSKSWHSLICNANWEDRRASFVHYSRNCELL